MSFEITVTLNVDAGQLDTGNLVEYLAAILWNIH